LCQKQFYTFRALWPHTYDVALDELDVLDILRAIRRDADKSIHELEATPPALGVLTSLSRHEWALARQAIIESSGNNAKALRLIDAALFVLVLDDFGDESSTARPDSIHDTAANMLHGTSQIRTRGDPSDPSLTCCVQVGTCLNRWYDKLQLIVCKNGSAGINFEHSAVVSAYYCRRIPS
jgi:carnitine O-acetyltransferase